MRRFAQDPTGADRYEYVSPRPGSSMVSRWNNIALRPGGAIDPGTVAAARFTVHGSASGVHEGAVSLSRDARTILFEPTVPFVPGERVEVSLGGGIRTRAGEELPPLAFDFTVGAGDPAEPWPAGLAEMLADDRSTGNAPPGDPATTGEGGELAAHSGGGPEAFACGPLPAGYPPINLLFSDQPDAGYVFLSPFRTVLPGHLVIVDNFAQPLFYRRIPRPSTDFKRQPDGRLTYFSRGAVNSGNKFYALDASYSVVDSFAAGNGYVTDSHELQVLPDGHCLLMIYDPQPVRMDLIVPNGRPNAIVTGLVIQELDADRNVVFQWRSWDHFEITDAVAGISLTGFAIDYVHGNAIEVDHDGNLLVSSRHLSEITKINRQTGAVMWRMGMHARKNEFTFVGDPRGFSFQHDVRRLPNGHITLFDNGNNIAPQLSRALEFEVDEVAKVATLVWSHRNTPDVFGSFMGNVQRRANGATLVGWGGTDPNQKLTDLHADGSTALALGMAAGTWSYRAFRFPWRSMRFTAEPEALEFGDVRLETTATRSVAVRNPGATAVTIDCAFATDPAFEIVAPLPVTLEPGGSLDVEVRFRPVEERRHSGKVYLRAIEATELIAQDVEVAGSGVTNRPPDCGPARATPGVLWPPSHDLVPITIEGVTDPDGDPVAIEITSILQDEPVAREEEPSCPDAVVENGTAWLRSERDGTGDGRVYVIGFAATDPAGARCEGSVRVCVPHDQGAGGTPEGANPPPEGCGDEAADVSSLEPCAAPDVERMRKGAPDAGARLAMRAGLEGVAGSGPGRVWVEFTLPADSDVSLALYDVAGRRVATLDAGPRAAGAHRVEWRATGVASGIYFCRIRAGGTEITRPLRVVK